MSCLTVHHADPIALADGGVIASACDGAGTINRYPATGGGHCRRSDQMHRCFRPSSPQSTIHRFRILTTQKTVASTVDPLNGELILRPRLRRIQAFRPSILHKGTWSSATSTINPRTGHRYDHRLHVVDPRFEADAAHAEFFVARLASLVIDLFDEVFSPTRERKTPSAKTQTERSFRRSRTRCLLNRGGARMFPDRRVIHQETACGSPTPDR